MKYYLSPLFKRLYKKLGFPEQEKIKRAISELAALLDSGIKSEGLGLKKLHENVWEVRASIEERVLFSFEKDGVFFLMIGSHDDVRNYLKKI